MNKEKQFDCIKFKNELQKNLLKNSGAKSLREYADYANKLALKSSLHKRIDTIDNIMDRQSIAEYEAKEKDGGVKFIDSAEVLRMLQKNNVK